MAKSIQTELLPRVHLTAVHTTKFKSSYMSVQFLAPLTEETAALNALVPMVLRRGTRRYGNMEKLSAALDELYGGTISPTIRKKGNTQCVGFSASFLDDAYTPDGSAVLSSAAQLLGELLLCPATEQGGFVRSYVDGEQANLADHIRAQLNDKRQYAALRLMQLMCREPDRLGDEKSVAAITGATLWAQYQTLLGCPIQIYYAGSAPFDQVEAAFHDAMEHLPGRGDVSAEVTVTAENRSDAAPREYEEALDVTQGKLALGFTTGVRVTDSDYPAMALCNAIFGGTTTSKLFLNVREKLSLCYYASAQLDKFKGLMLVSSGVEFNRRSEAQREILAQLESCKSGAFEPWELEAARRSVVSSFQTLLDSQSRMEDFWLGQTVAAGDTPEQLIEKLEQVSAEEVVAAAQKIKLHTVYFLKGKEDTISG